ncbi:arginase family protein, partial [Candidatus Pelagibacter bacterium]|nr:arginase family protein [Candidatus Pelagibacter bacterium]
MKYLSQKKGFLGYDANQNIEPKVIVVPFGLEKTVSYGSGTKNGPREIIKASHQVELFDEELNKEPYREIGIKTIKPFAIKKKIRNALDQLSAINKEILSKNKFPMVFGGEHSITPGSIKPFVNKYNQITLLHFDAHADLRESYQGEK